MNNVYLEDEVLPGEVILAEKYNVSRNTLRQALAVLCEDGLIIKTRGKGTVVAKRDSNPFNKQIVNPMTALSKEKIDDIKIQYNYSSPTDIARNKLGLRNSDIVLACTNVYSVRGTVAGYSFIQIPTSVFSELEVDASKSDEIRLLVNSRIYEAAGKQSIAIKLVFVNEIETEFLKVKEGTPIILIESILYSRSGEPFARCKFYFISEYYRLQFLL
jgi:GntR family transcriptional regulator